MTNVQLQLAIDYFGNQDKLAKAMGLNAQCVTMWKKRGLPIKRALEIVRLTHGVVRLGDLLPDYFLVPEMITGQSGDELNIIRDKRSSERRALDRRKKSDSLKKSNP